MSAEALASDPNFDVEKMFYYLDMHEGEPNLIVTLLQDPYIMLSVAEGINFRVLERHARRIDHTTVFPKFEQLGFEFWEKKTVGSNVWYGIVAAEDLAIHYRLANRQASLEVLRGETAAETARARWKKLNMLKKGDEDNQRAAHGNRHIDLIRQAVYDGLLKIGYDSRFAFTTFRNTKSIIHLRRNIKPNDYRAYDLKLYITAKGPNKLLVHYSGTTNRNIGTFNSESPASESFTRVINKNNDIFKTPDEVAQDVIKWLATKSAHVKEVANVSV